MSSDPPQPAGRTGISRLRRVEFGPNFGRLTAIEVRTLALACAESALEFYDFIIFSFLSPSSVECETFGLFAGGL